MLVTTNKDFVFLKEAQDNFNKILGGSKQFGGVSEFSLKAIVSDSLPVSMYVENKKLNLETGNFVEIAIKLPTDVYLPIDSHWPMERFNEVQEALKTNDKILIKKSNSNIKFDINDRRSIITKNSVLTSKVLDKSKFIELNISKVLF